MDILVCVKQVPDDSVEIHLNPSTMKPDLSKTLPQANAFDTYALEMAVRYCEANGGTVSVVSFGPKDNETSLRSCLAVGAKNAFLVSDAGLEDADPSVTAAVLAAAVPKMPSTRITARITDHVFFIFLIAGSLLHPLCRFSPAMRILSYQTGVVIHSSSFFPFYPAFSPCSRTNQAISSGPAGRTDRFPQSGHLSGAFPPSASKINQQSRCVHAQIMFFSSFSIPVHAAVRFPARGAGDADSASSSMHFFQAYPRTRRNPLSLRSASPSIQFQKYSGVHS